MFDIITVQHLFNKFLLKSNIRLNFDLPDINFLITLLSHFKRITNFNMFVFYFRDLIINFTLCSVEKLMTLFQVSVLVPEKKVTSK